MKKMKKFLVPVFSFCMCVAMAACSFGENYDDYYEKQMEDLRNLTAEALTRGAQKEADAAKEDVKEEAKPYKTIQDYLDNNEDEQEEIQRNAEASGITMNLLTEGDSTLVYQCTYHETIDVTDEVLAAAEEEFAKIKGVMDQLIAELSSTVEAKNISIVVRYYNPDGTVIFTHTYR